VSCTVQGPSGQGTSTQPIKVEISKPTASAVPRRPPDHHGWYNHPLRFKFRGRAFSGIASCTTAKYSGPNSRAATASGSCTDNAGKIARATSPPFQYDAAPPAVAIDAHPGDRVVALHWKIVRDVDQLASTTIVRAPGRHGRKTSVIYRGHGTAYRDTRVRDGVRYSYTLRTKDQAGNRSERTIVVTPGPRLLSPRPGARVSAPPLLRWTPVRRATYYNIQLYRSGTKILSAWRSHARLQLQRRWRFHGHRYVLKPGTYRWYVWPGFGRRAAGRYGPLIGNRTFVVFRPA
jgi:hypothetical protein